MAHVVVVVVADGTPASRAATFVMTSLIRWFRDDCNDSAGPQVVTLEGKRTQWMNRS